MTIYTRIAIIASIAALAGCEAPSDIDAPDEQIAGQFSGSDTDERAAAAVALGQLNDENGLGLVGATICVVDGNTCVISDEDGAWEIKGIGSGYTEQLEINAAGYIPTIVLMDMGGRDTWTNVNMVPSNGLFMEPGAPQSRCIIVSGNSVPVADGYVTEIAHRCSIRPTE